MVTNEQVNAVLARSGLSMEGFEAFRKRKHGEHKQTKESWLKDLKTSEGASLPWVRIPPFPPFYAGSGNR